MTLYINLKLDIKSDVSLANASFPPLLCTKGKIL